MSAQERIQELLGAGVSQVQAALAVGVDESYVSQLMAEENFRAAVVAKRAESAALRAGTDKSIDSIEDKAWKKIEQLIPLETNLMKLLKVATAANAAKRGTSRDATAGNNAGTVVNITMPQSALVEFKMTTDKQVVEIDGRSMNTMSSAKVQAALRERQAKELVQDVTPQVSQKTAVLLKDF